MEQVPLFRDVDPYFLTVLLTKLEFEVFLAKETIIQVGVQVVLKQFKFTYWLCNGYDFNYDNGNFIMFMIYNSLLLLGGVGTKQNRTKLI